MAMPALTYHSRLKRCEDRASTATRPATHMVAPIQGTGAAMLHWAASHPARTMPVITWAVRGAWLSLLTASPCSLRRGRKPARCCNFNIRQERHAHPAGQADQGCRVAPQPVQDDQRPVGQVNRQVHQQDAHLIEDGHWSPAGSKVTRVT